MDFGFARKIAQNIPNGAVIIFDQKLTFILAEGTSLEKHGYSKDFTEGKTVYEVLSPKGLETLLPYYQATLKGESAHFTYQAPMGTFWVKFEPFYQQDEVIAGLIFIIEVSELENQKKELQDYFYLLSHDIKTPFNTILGLIDVLRTEKDSREKDKMLDLIEHTAKHSLDFVSRVLDPQYAIIDLDALLKEVKEKTLGFPNQSHIEFLCKIQYTKGKFRSIPSLLQSILENLICNAYKYHDLHCHQAFVEVQVLETSKDVSFTIRDNGPGVAKDKIGKLTNKNYRIDRRKDGHGYGLYLVNQHLKKLGSTLEIYSELGAGSTFSFHLPYK